MESESHHGHQIHLHHDAWDRGDAQRSLLAKVEAQWGEPAHLEVDFAERLDVLVRWGGLGRLRELIAPITVALSKVETVVFEDAYDAANFTQALKAIESTWEGRVLLEPTCWLEEFSASDEKVAVLDCCRSREPGKTRELLSLAGQPVVDGIFDDTGTCCGGRLGLRAMKMRLWRWLDDAARNSRQDGRYEDCRRVSHLF